MIVANSHAGIEEIKEFTKKPKLKAIENICEFKNIKIKKDKNFDKLFINNKKTISSIRSFIHEVESNVFLKDFGLNLNVRLEK